MPATIYAVSAVWTEHRADCHITHQLPTFYLLADAQGIVDEQHAHRIACSIFDKLGRSDAVVFTAATSTYAHPELSQ